MPQSLIPFTIETVGLSDNAIRATVYVGDIPVLTKFYRESGPARHDTVRHFMTDELGIRLKGLLDP